jgi:phosphoesterase, MJ0936 family
MSRTANASLIGLLAKLEWNLVMRIIVISDTHGDLSGFERAVDQQPKADLFIHLGDCERDLDQVKPLFPDKRFLSVAGNCDFGSDTPTESETIARGRRIFFTHGHPYHVKFGYASAIGEARRRGADILLFGHTHLPYTAYEDGLYIMNPGSLGHPRDGHPTYGIVDITDAGIVLNIAEV